MLLNFFGNKSRKPNERSELLKSNEIIHYSKDYKSFGFDYFDNKDSIVGYGGYKYDGRFSNSVKRMIDHYNLKKNSKVLEVGCAKGYILKEFHDQKMLVYGLDYSKYAIQNSHQDIKSKLVQWDIRKKTSYPDNYFDLVYSKELLPHLSSKDISSILNEFNRISKNKKSIFIEIQTSKTSEGLKLINKWDPTHKSLLLKKDWLNLFKKNNYQGDYYFKNLI